MNILIVDDNRDLADGLRVLLDCEGHNAIASYSGEDVITNINVREFDVILLDVKLPGISGIEVYQHIRKLKLNIQIFFITAYRIDRFLSEVMGNCKVDILHEPFSDKQLLDKLISINKTGILLVHINEQEFISETKQLLHKNNYNPITISNNPDDIDKIPDSGADVLVFNSSETIVKSLNIIFALKERGISLPIIFNSNISNYNDTSTDAFHSLAVTGCIFKPFTPDQLLHNLEVYTV